MPRLASRRRRKPRNLDSKIRSQVKKVLNKRVEKKYHLQSETGISPIYGTPILTSLSDISQGDTDTTRDGDSAYLRTVRVQGELAVDATTPTAAIVRVIVFKWLADSSQDAPAVSSILSSAYTSSARVVSAPYHHDMRRKFRVLFDKNYSLVPSTTSALRKFDTGYIKLLTKVSYIAAGTHGANKIYILMTSSINSNGPDCNYVAKLTFNDM